MPCYTNCRLFTTAPFVGLCLASLAGSVSAAGDAQQDLDFLVIVERFAGGGFDADLQVDADPSMFAEVRLAIPGEPSVPFENEDPGSFELGLSPDGSFEGFLTDDASGEFIDIQFVSVAGPVSVYRFNASEVFGPQVDLATVPGFPVGLAITPGDPTRIEWSSPAEPGEFVAVFAEGGDPLTPDLFFQTASSLPFTPPLLAGLDQSLAFTDTEVAVPQDFQGVAFATVVSYGIALGSFTPQLISGPALDIGNAVGIVLSSDETAFEPAACPADLAEPFGVLDLSDIVAFVSAFGSQDPAADITNDGLFDLSDIVAFVGAFNAGCP